MDELFDSLPALIGLGAGLAILGGLRAFLPLALVALIAGMDLFGPLDLNGTAFAFLQDTWVLVLLFVLALAEIIVDKIPLLSSVQDFVTTPTRVVAGAALFGVALAQEDGILIIGGMLVGALLAGATLSIRGALRPAAAVETAGAVDPFLSLFEDIAAVAGTVLVILVPFVGYLLVAFLLFLIYRVGRRRRRKYRGLRVLRD